MIGQRCLVHTAGSKLLGAPMVGYSRWPSPLNGFKTTYKWLGQPLSRSLKYRQLCTPDGGCQRGVTSPVNTNTRTDTRHDERSLHPDRAHATYEVGRPAISEGLMSPHIERFYISSRSAACLSLFGSPCSEQEHGCDVIVCGVCALFYYTINSGITYCPILDYIGILQPLR